MSARIVSLCVLLLAIAGCSTLPRNPVPVEKFASAQPVGMPGVRAWGGEINPVFQQDLIESIHQEPDGEFSRHRSGVPVYDALALSGGGSVGAFGAGFLYGWTATGTRPNFKIVTGISTGALIAPFAFVGPEHDEQLKKVYTTISTEDIMEERSYLSILGNESVATTDPLANLIAENFDQAFLEEVAAAHDRGRRLYIGTTHLDAERLVVWNMGLIAKTGHPDALELFHKILLASASIPVAFPPVLVEVEVDGQRYDEMHVDGGTMTQVFFYGGTVDLQAAATAAGLSPDVIHKANIYIIRNGQVTASPQQMRRSLLDISGRSISTMIKSAGRSDLYRIYVFAQKEQVDFNYVDVPPDFEFSSEEAFDQEEMNRLFERGYQLATSGDPWKKAPPGFAAEGSR